VRHRQTGDGDGGEADRSIEEHCEIWLNHPLLQGFNKPGGFVLKAKEKILQ